MPYPKVDPLLMSMLRDGLWIQIYGQVSILFLYPDPCFSGSLLGTKVLRPCHADQRHPYLALLVTRCVFHMKFSNTITVYSILQ